MSPEAIDAFFKDPLQGIYNMAADAAAEKANGERLAFIDDTAKRIFARDTPMRDAYGAYRQAEVLWDARVEWLKGQPK